MRQGTASSTGAYRAVRLETSSVLRPKGLGPHQPWSACGLLTVCCLLSTSCGPCACAMRRSQRQLHGELTAGLPAQAHGSRRQPRVMPDQRAPWGFAPVAGALGLPQLRHVPMCGAPLAARPAAAPEGRATCAAGAVDAGRAATRAPAAAAAAAAAEERQQLPPRWHATGAIWSVVDGAAARPR
jgi:hypothetical protein